MAQRVSRFGRLGPLSVRPSWSTGDQLEKRAGALGTECPWPLEKLDRPRATRANREPGRRAQGMGHEPFRAGARGFGGLAAKPPNSIRPAAQPPPFLALHVRGGVMVLLRGVGSGISSVAMASGSLPFSGRIPEGVAFHDDHVGVMQQAIHRG